MNIKSYPLNRDQVLLYRSIIPLLSGFRMIHAEILDLEYGYKLEIEGESNDITDYVKRLNDLGLELNT
jgi:hypothetical protein